jgi:hypothetical protein
MSGLPISQVPLNLTGADPDFSDAMDALKRDVFLSLNCHAIGVVQAFDPTLQRATVQIPYKKTFYERDPVDGTYSPVLEDYPLLLECPVVVPGGGDWLLTFPLTVGDECVVLFNDRDLDNWISGQTGTGVASARAHSFADGIILVGPRSLPNAKAVTSYSTSATELRNRAGTVKVSLTETAATVTVGGAHPMTLTLDAVTGKITLGNGTGTLGADLSTLVSNLSTMASTVSSTLTSLSGACTATPAGTNGALATPFGTLATAFSTLATGLSSVSTQLTGLLA